eukprot:gnl/MRDRNA2_/MRDRNA2_320951_c0_seq1.p1 gnl/MRDRNA2_/MRDRNA2_320951_c0~~gnl/MRDRNA2_/MRDRNA2_320951_c0_seq1.p1  ORF type:complete len:380 (+),score=44.39 gnl/MRDRNA2_/MRDRNA2_320951_c0_seq1:163-1302(+)
MSQSMRGVVACISFIFFGVTSTLSITASEVNKKLPYNTTSVNLLVESVKFLVVAIWWFTEEWSKTPKDSSSIVPVPNISFKTFMMYSIPGVMYAVNNQLLYYAVFHLQPGMFQLASNMKFVSTAILFRLVLQKTLTSLQWLGIVTLVLGMTVSKAGLIANCSGEPRTSMSSLDEGQKSLVVGLFIVMVTSVISGMSGIANEYLLKKVDENAPLSLKNMQLYLWGILLNLGGAVSEAKGDSQAAFRGFSMWVWTIIFLKSAEGVSISFIMRYLDNIVKCFASAIVVYVTTLSSYMVFGEPVDFFFVLGLAVVTVALYMYFGPHNDAIKQQEAAMPVCGDDGEKSYRFCGRPVLHWGPVMLKVVASTLVLLLIWQFSLQAP